MQDATSELAASLSPSAPPSSIETFISLGWERDFAPIFISETNLVRDNGIDAVAVVLLLLPHLLLPLFPHVKAVADFLPPPKGEGG